MADKKISALTAATLPLAGTEVLPIVQSGSTVKVATDDLTVKNIRSNATSGLLQVAGPGAGTTRVMTTPNANFTAARTDAAQSFTGDQTLSTGNLVQGTAAKGVNFTANTPAAGMTSQLLNWYEEGTWTPALTCTTPPTTPFTTEVVSATYTRVGRQVTVVARIRTTSVNIAGADGYAIVTGLPFTAASDSAAAIGVSTSWNTNHPTTAVVSGATLYLYYRATSNGATTNVLYSDITTGSSTANNLFFTGTYFV